MSASPTVSPTDAPTENPTVSPTGAPSKAPTVSPTTNFPFDNLNAIEASDPTAYAIITIGITAILAVMYWVSWKRTLKENFQGREKWDQRVVQDFWAGTGVLWLAVIALFCGTWARYSQVLDSEAIPGLRLPEDITAVVMSTSCFGLLMMLTGLALGDAAHKQHILEKSIEALIGDVTDLARNTGWRGNKEAIRMYAKSKVRAGAEIKEGASRRVMARPGDEWFNFIHSGEYNTSYPDHSVGPVKAGVFVTSILALTGPIVFAAMMAYSWDPYLNAISQNSRVFALASAIILAGTLLSRIPYWNRNVPQEIGTAPLDGLYESFAKTYKWDRDYLGGCGWAVCVAPFHCVMRRVRDGLPAPESRSLLGKNLQRFEEDWQARKEVKAAAKSDAVPSALHMLTQFYGAKQTNNVGFQSNVLGFQTGLKGWIPVLDLPASFVFAHVVAHYVIFLDIYHDRIQGTMAFAGTAGLAGLLSLASATTKVYPAFYVTCTFFYFTIVYFMIILYPENRNWAYMGMDGDDASTAAFQTTDRLLFGSAMAFALYAIGDWVLSPLFLDKWSLFEKTRATTAMIHPEFEGRPIQIGDQYYMRDKWGNLINITEEIRFEGGMRPPSRRLKSDGDDLSSYYAR